MKAYVAGYLYIYRIKWFIINNILLNTLAIIQLSEIRTV